MYRDDYDGGVAEGKHVRAFPDLPFEPVVDCRGEDAQVLPVPQILGPVKEQRAAPVRQAPAYYLVPG